MKALLIWQVFILCFHTWNGYFTWISLIVLLHCRFLLYMMMLWREKKRYLILSVVPYIHLFICFWTCIYALLIDSGCRLNFFHWIEFILISWQPYCYSVYFVNDLTRQSYKALTLGLWCFKSSILIRALFHLAFFIKLYALLGFNIFWNIQCIIMLYAWRWLGSILLGLIHLETLNLSFTLVTDSGLKKSSGLTSLKSFNLDARQITDAGLSALTS